MSRLLSIFMSILILAQSFNIGVDNLSKLNVLLAHAQYHQEQFGDSFFDFLVEHYGADFKHNHDEKNDHQNLPFKHHDCSHYTTYIAQKLEFHFKNNPDYCYLKPSFFYKEFYSFFGKTSIFQPPKHA